jgi:Leucine-rich repeat (LRR) protein
VRALILLLAACSAASASPTSLHDLMKHGRQCPQASFAQLADTTAIDDLPVECLDAFARTAKLPHLAHLSITCGDGTSIDFDRLARFKELVELRFAFGCKRDARGLAPLAALPKLRVLDDPDSVEVVGVEKLSQLEELGISSESDLAPLAALTHLKKLSVDLYPKGDLAPLAKLTGLESLELSAKGAIDIEPLHTLAGLKHLEIRARAITHLEALAPLAQLRELDIEANPLAAMASSAALPKLTKLSIDITDSAWIAPLSKAKQLNELTLVSGCTEVTIDLAPLAKLPHLEGVVLEGVIHPVNREKLSGQVMDFAPHHCGFPE